MFDQAKMPLRADQIERIKKQFPFVDEIENAGMDEGRFFVHLKQTHTYPCPYSEQRTMSFGGYREAVAMIKQAIKSEQ